MVMNLGEIALACAVARENKYTDSQIAGAAGINENQVGWMVRAGRDGVQRSALELCESIDAFCAFMLLIPKERMRVVKSLLGTDSLITVWSITRTKTSISGRTKTTLTNNAGASI